MSDVGASSRLQTYLFVGLSLSIGWGIRGNFGHEWGAALPGALAAMAAALIAGRADWLRRIAYFGVFGAIGWSLGGSMAYMVVIAYTHSGQSSSVLYGFTCLCIIGFLWAAVGGAAAALPAFLTRERLCQFFSPLALTFVLWWIFELITTNFVENNPRFMHRSPLDWYDTNWHSASLAILAVLLTAGHRRRLTWADRLILWMAGGWWIGFLALRVGLHLAMAPNKSDNWAGSIGMTAALIIFLYRSNLKGAVLAGLITGVLGGLAFAVGVMFKLVEVKISGDYPTNWHSILEQSYGLMNGFAQAAGLLVIIKTAPQASDDPPVARFYNGFAVAFLLPLLTYLNMYKEVNDWVASKTMPQQLYMLSAHGWFDLFYALLACTFLLLISQHFKRPIALIPQCALGKAQMLYLALLWWMIVANFIRALVQFAPQRLVTEGVIFVNGLICTLMALIWARGSGECPAEQATEYWPAIRRTIVQGALALALCPLLCWGVVRAMYGDRFAGEAGHHYRFGPSAVPAKE